MNNELNEHLRDEQQKKERVLLRAKFAGMAMQGILSNEDSGPYLELSNRVANLAVKYADALIAELDKEPNHE